MKEWKKSRWLMPLLLILVGILLEIFVFNFRHWEAYLWKDEHRNFEEQILGEGLEQVNDSLYRVTAENGEETSCIELLNIQQKLPDDAELSDRTGGGGSVSGGQLYFLEFRAELLFGRGEFPLPKFFRERSFL